MTKFTESTTLRFCHNMVRHNFLAIMVTTLLITELFGCHQTSKEPADEAVAHAIVPVKTGMVSNGPVAESIELNATSSFIKRNVVRSTAIGYVNKINAQLGDQVEAGQKLFILETKEARILGNNLFKNEPDLHFSGLIPIKASQPGFITGIYHQVGDYIQEGDSLCSIVDQHSLVFILNVPYEFNGFIKMGETCQISLPDGRTFKGTIYSKIAVMDAVSQTQRYLVKALLPDHLPENLIARVKLFKRKPHTALLVPHSAVLSNEEQTEFWVMKVVNDTLAIKVPILKGIETSDQVELINSQLQAGQKVLVGGNYGLADTTTVKIEK